MGGGERGEEVLVENLERSSLNRSEEAHAFARLISLGRTQIDIARRIGKSQSYVCRRLRLLTLPPEVRQQVERHEVPVAQALGDHSALPEDPFPAHEDLHRARLA